MEKVVKTWAIILTILTITTNIAAVIMIFFYTPTEIQMGDVQKIFYYHVPFAISSYFMLFVSFVFSILYLIKGNEKYDIWAYAGAEIGLVFIVCVLASGTIWGRSVWGKWWVWEPRLTTFLIIFLIYSSYILVRIFGKNDLKTPKIAAVLSIVGFLDVPIINRAIHWWGSIVHPKEVSLEAQMKYTFAVSLVSVILLSLSLFIWRVIIDKRILEEND